MPIPLRRQVMQVAGLGQMQRTQRADRRERWGKAFAWMRLKHDCGPLIQFPCIPAGSHFHHRHRAEVVGEGREFGARCRSTLRLIPERYFGFNAHASKEHDDDA